MSSLDDFFFPHSVTVRDRTLGGGMGGGFRHPRSLRAEVKDQKRLVRDKNGAEVVSSTSVTVALDAEVPLGSEVTVWLGTADERSAFVIATSRDDNGAPLMSHSILYLE